jgi:hypothetical protein
MAYRKRYEDTYLDDAGEDENGQALSEGQRIAQVVLESDDIDARKGELDERVRKLFLTARIPAGPGREAIEGLQLVAEAYLAKGATSAARGIYADLLSLSEEIGNGELYYWALDKIETC